MSTVYIMLTVSTVSTVSTVPTVSTVSAVYSAVPRTSISGSILSPGLEASLAEAEAKAKAKKGKMSASKNTTNDSSASETTTTDVPSSEQDAIEALEKGEDYNAESEHTKHGGQHEKVNKKTKKKKKKGVSNRKSGKKNEQSRDYGWAKVRRLLNHYCHPETHSVNGKGDIFYGGGWILSLFHLLTWKTLSAYFEQGGSGEVESQRCEVDGMPG